MEAVIRDVRYALRRLARSPGFTLLAMLPLAVGIGANSTIFSFVNAALLATLPVERPEEIRRLAFVSADGTRTGRLSYADYADYRDRSEVFSDLVAVSLEDARHELVLAVFPGRVAHHAFLVIEQRVELQRILPVETGHVRAGCDVLCRGRHEAPPRASGRKLVYQGPPVWIRRKTCVRNSGSRATEFQAQIFLLANPCCQTRISA